MKKAVIWGIFLIILVSVNVGVCSASGPPIEWAKTFGGSSDDNAQSVQQTADGGYILAGSTYSNDVNVIGKYNTTVDTDVWVVKLNPSGTLDWQKCLGGSADDRADSVQQTADGGYIVAGTTSSNTTGDVGVNHGSNDVWVVKLNSAGTVIWQKCLGGTGSDYAKSIRQTADGGYIVAGSTTSGNNGDVYGIHSSTDYWVVKLNPSGSLEWQKCLGGNRGDYGYSVQQTTDGGYIVAGESASTTGDLVGSNHHGSSYDFWVVKLNATGNMSWNRSYGSSGGDYAKSIQQTADGGYIVAGVTDTNDGDVSGKHGSPDYWVVRLDPAGNLVWQNCLGGTGGNYGYSINQTADGGYSVAGFTSSNTTGDVGVNHGSYDIWTVQLNATGGIVWQKCIGGTSDDMAYSISQTADGGLIVAGESSSTNGDVSSNHGGLDLLVVKLAAYTPPPVANFTVNITHGTAPLTVRFNDTSTGSPTAWNWSFGDGNYSISRNPEYMYPEPGNYTVSLNVTNAGGSNITIRTSYITVNPLIFPVAGFSANITSGKVPLTVQFYDNSTGSPASWEWDFGEGALSTDQNPVHVYQTLGNFTVNLNVTNADGFNLTSKTDYIHVGYAQFTMFRSNPEHTGVYNGTGIDTDNRLRWNFPTGGYIRSSPAVADGVVYIGSSDHNLYAIDALTGAKKWNFTTAGTIDSSPAVVNGVVYVSSSDRTLYAIFMENGTEKWHRFDTYLQTNSPPVVSEGVIYIGGGPAASTQVGAFFADNGTEKWVTTAGNRSVSSSPAVSNGVVYFGCSDYKIYAVYTATRVQKWAYTTSGPVLTSPAVADGVVYAGSDDGNVYAIYVSTGLKKWQFVTIGAVDSSPAVADGVVYVGSDDGTVYAIDAASGVERWEFVTGGAVDSSPAVADGIVYVGSDDNNVYAIYASNGTEKWRRTTGGDVESSPAVAEGTVYVGSSDGNIYAIGNISAPPPPHADFISDISSGPAPLTVQFSDTSSGVVTSWNWDFGDNSSSSERNPVHQYLTAGMYTVRLTTGNVGGIYDTITKSDFIRADFAAVTTFRANPRHTGLFTGSGIETDNRLKWSFWTGDVIRSSPVIADGVVYAGSDDHNVYAVFSGNGTRKWFYDAGDLVRSSPAVADGVIYFGCSNNKVSAVFVENGTRKWEVHTGIGVSSSPSLADGLVYVGSGDNGVYAIHARTGAIKWHFTTGGGILSSPAVADGVVYVGSGDHNIYAINSTNGALIWNFTTGDIISSSPAVLDGVVYAGSSDENLYAIFAGNGTKRWNSTVWSFDSSPAIADGVVYIGGNDFNVSALFAENGTIKWRYTTGGQVPMSPAIADGIVYIGSRDNNVYALFAGNGTKKWNYTYGTSGILLRSSPAVADGVVFIGSDDGRLLAIGNISAPYSPVASFTADVRDGTVPLLVHFNDTSAHEPTAWNWSFGDGTLSDLRDPVHNFTVAGNYAIVLTVSNAFGSDNVTRPGYITVNLVQPPVTDFAADSRAGIHPLTVHFADLSTGLRTEWLWDFGDGTLSSDQNPVHEYLDPGTYTVTLTVNNTGGSSTRTKEEYIAVDFASAVMFHGDSRHTGVYDGGGIETDSRMKWRFDTLANVSTSPAVAGGIVYFGSDDRNVYAIYAANGTLVWNFTTGNKVKSSPAVADSIVYAGSDDRNVYALYAGNGTMKWNFTGPVSNSISSAPSVANGVVYIGSDNNRLYALNASNGSQLWRYDGAGIGRSSPAVADGVVYSPGGSALVAVHAGNGTQKWVHATGGNIDSSPAVADGIVYFGSSDLKVHALYVGNGSEKWHFTAGFGVSTSPAIANGVIYIGSDDNRIHAIRAGNGTEKWNFSTLGRVLSSPGIADGIVYVGSDDSRVYALFAGNGTEKWNYSTTGMVRSSPAVSSGVVYTGSEDGTLYAIGNIGAPYAPVANFTSNITSGKTPLAVQFYDNSTSGIPASWNWSFDDDTFSYDQNPIHVFQEPGLYSVTLTAGNGGGSTTKAKVGYIRVDDGGGNSTPSMFRADLQRTGVYPDYGSAPNNRLKWRFSTDGGYYNGSVRSTPAVADGVVYFGSSDDNVYAVYAGNGTKKWNFTTKISEFPSPGVESSPAILDGIVYVGSPYDGLYAIYAGNGTKKWQFKSGDFFGTASSPVVDDIFVYIGNSVDIVAIQTRNGKERWRFTTGGTVRSSPTISDGIIYVGSDDHKIYALHKGNGTEKWNFTTLNPVTSSPAVADGTVYVASGISLYAINATSGEQKFRYDTMTAMIGDIQYSPAVADGVVYLGSDNRKLYAIDAGNGTEKWNYTTLANVRTSPAVADGIVYIASEDRYVYAVHATNGTELWRFNNTWDPIPTFWTSSPAVAGGMVYIGHMDGCLYAIGNNSPLASFTVNASSGNYPLTAQFYDTSLGAPSSWNWSFGDGTWYNTTVAGARNVTHTYQDEGTYIANLTISNSYGTHTSDSIVITARGIPPIAGFTADISHGAAPLTVQFTDTTMGIPIAWNWSFGDGTWFNTTDPAQWNPLHTYPHAGTYTVNLVATNITFGKSSTTIADYIHADFASSAMYRANPGHTGEFDAGGIELNNQLKWSFKTGREIMGSSPAVLDGVVYIGSDDRNVYALFAENGTKIWNFTTDGMVSSSPAVGDGLVFVRGGTSTYALFAGNGTQKWRTQHGGSLRQSSLTIVDGTLYGGSWDNSLYAIDAWTGVQKARYDTGGLVTTSPAVADGVLYVGCDDLYAFNASTGLKMWNFTTGWPFEEAPSVRDGIVYAGSLDGRLYAIHADTGTEKWNFTCWPDYSAPAVVDGIVYIGSRSDFNIYAIYATNGTEKWRFTTGGQVHTSPAVADNVVYVISWDNKLYALHAENGTEKWNMTTPSDGVISSPAVANGTVFFGCEDGNVFAVGNSISQHAPIASFWANGTSGSSPLVVRFTDTSVSDPIAWNWSFGDGTFTTEQNPVHTYTTGGTFTVSLTATNAGGSITITKAGYITVRDIIAGFYSNLTSGPAPLTVQFTDTTMGIPIAWNWSFGDGVWLNTMDPAQRNPVHTYLRAGTYTVNLIATNISSGKDSITITDYIHTGFASSAMYRANPGHTGVYDTGGIEPVNRLKWNYTTGNSVFSSPAVLNGVVYIGSDDRKIYAIDAVNGTRKWSFTTDGTVRSSPAVGDGLVFARSSKSTYSLFAENGTERWRWKVPTDESLRKSSLAVVDGIIYGGSYDNSLYAIDAWTGNGKVRYDTGGTVTSSPAVAEGVVYVGCDDHNLYAFNASTGQKKWNFTTSWPLTGDPAVRDGIVYVGSLDGRLYAIHADTGTEKWNFTCWPDYSAPAVADGIVYIGSRSDFNIYAIYAANGTEKWRFTTAGEVHTSPAIADNVVYVISWDNKLYALHAENGTEKWNMTIPAGGVDSSPAVADGTVYFGSTSGDILAVGTNAIPVANFTTDVISGRAPLTVQFTDRSIGAPAAWNWSFGDGTFSPVRNPVHTYTGYGTFTVRLTVARSGLTNTTVPGETVTVFPRGDFNTNWRVDIGDVTYVAYMAAGLIPPDPGANFNMDFDPITGTPRIDVADAAMIAWYYVGKIPTL